MAQVDMLGGSIGLNSAPGRGSTFHVWIPERFGQTAPKQAAVS